ncbi:hypothetical protein MTO96_022488 [Rhipicephalus appendiculatus]
MPDSSMRDQASMNIRTELATETQPARADVTTSSASEDFFSFGLQTLPAETQGELSRYLLVPAAVETAPPPTGCGTDCGREAAPTRGCDGEEIEEREEPMVQCDRCRRWAYLDETDFPSTDAADATAFVCNLCNTIEVLETRLRASETEIETLRGVILAVKEQLQEPLKVDEHSCSPPASPDCIHSIADAFGGGPAEKGARGKGAGERPANAVGAGTAGL